MTTIQTLDTISNYHLRTKFRRDDNVYQAPNSLHVFHFVVNGDRLDMFMGDDRDGSFRIAGRYSGDDKRSAYSHVTITPDFDRCVRRVLHKNDTQNCRADAKNSLRIFGIVDDDARDADPFGFIGQRPQPPPDPDPFGSVPPAGLPPRRSVPPPDVPSRRPVPRLNVPRDNPDSDWDSLVPSSFVSNANISSELFNVAGNHSIRPNHFNSLMEELPLTIDDVKVIYKIAKDDAPTDNILEGVIAAGSVMKASTSAWSKTQFSSSISAAQNSNRGGYDYFGVCSVFMNAAMTYYNKSGRFNVIPSA